MTDDDFPNVACGFCGHEWAAPNTVPRCPKCGHSDLRTVAKTED